jgi:hypothetical protein
MTTATGLFPDLMRLILTQFCSFSSNILRLNFFLLRPFTLLRPLLTQTYRGDITIVYTHAFEH